MDKLLDAVGGCDRGRGAVHLLKFDGSVKEGNSMRAFVISASLVLAVTQVAPALGEDANHIIPGCRAVTDEQSFKDLAEARECLGIIEGMRVGATLQSHILKGPAPFCIPNTVTRSQMVRAVVDYIDRQSPILTTGAPDKDANMLSYFAYFAMREAWPCNP